jgi:hypothetical protein
VCHSEGTSQATTGTGWGRRDKCARTIGCSSIAKCIDIQKSRRCALARAGVQKNHKSHDRWCGINIEYRLLCLSRTLLPRVLVSLLLCLSFDVTQSSPQSVDFACACRIASVLPLRASDALRFTAGSGRATGSRSSWTGWTGDDGVRAPVLDGCTAVTMPRRRDSRRFT